MKLTIKGFKCFVNQAIAHKQLTVYAGANGRGKSTVTQALLLLRATLENYGTFSKKTESYDLKAVQKKEIPLNGPYMLNLGNSSAVQSKQSTDNTIISFELENDSDKLTVSFHADQYEAQLYLTITNKKIEGDISKFPITQQGFYYLNAERLGPRIIQEVCHQKFPNTGFKGEFTAQVLNLESGLFKISKDRWRENTKNPQILFQTNEWLNYILPQTRINVDSNNTTNTAQIVIENEFTISDPVLATNIGFGISYVLPIIVTCLVAQENSIVIIENPEAHLHPGAQSKIGQFLAIMAASGLHIIVETHSDHVINGIQIAVALSETNHEDIIVNFFAADEDGIQPDVRGITVSNKGELSDWPKGFFDQTQIDFATLIQAQNA